MAGLISCDALGATYCSEGVAGLISGDIEDVITGLIVLGCSRYDVVITGGGGVDLL